MRQGMTPTLIGVLIGGGGAFWLTHLLAGFLFVVKPLDAVSFIATLVLSIVALFSIWMPAIRATLNPMAALRIEWASSDNRWRWDER
jgi:hypothetical protein